MSYSERRKEQAQKTETAILNAALELMRQDGFEAVTVRDICKHAGITTGAFYHHFKSKEELFDKGFAPLDQFMGAVLENCQDEGPVARLRIVLDHYALFMENCGTLAAQYYQRRLGNPDTASLDPCWRTVLRRPGSRGITFCATTLPGQRNFVTAIFAAS